MGDTANRRCCICPASLRPYLEPISVGHVHMVRGPSGSFGSRLVAYWNRLLESSKLRSVALRPTLSSGLPLSGFNPVNHKLTKKNQEFQIWPVIYSSVSMWALCWSALFLQEAPRNNKKPSKKRLIYSNVSSLFCRGTPTINSDYNGFRGLIFYWTKACLLIMVESQPSTIISGRSYTESGINSP